MTHVINTSCMRAKKDILKDYTSGTVRTVSPIIGNKCPKCGSKMHITKPFEKAPEFIRGDESFLIKTT